MEPGYLNSILLPSFFETLLSPSPAAGLRQVVPVGRHVQHSVTPLSTEVVRRMAAAMPWSLVVVATGTDFSIALK